MNQILKLSIIIISVSLAGYIFEEALDSTVSLDEDLKHDLENNIEIISEIVSIFVSFSIFAMTWYAHGKSRDNHSLFMGWLFLITGFLIFLHTLSYPFMPDFITPNSGEKSATFFIESRLLLALLFLASAYVFKDTLPKLINKNILLSYTLLLSAIFFGTLIFYKGSQFETYDFKGYTSATNLFLATITIISLIGIYLYIKRFKDAQDRNLIFLISGFSLVTISNLLYFFNEFSGHFLIIAGFYYVHLGLFRSSVEFPYEKLSIAEDKLRVAAENKYQNLFDNANDAIVSIDLEENITAWNPAAEKTFGWFEHEALGKRFSKLIVPPDKQSKKDKIIRSILSGKIISGIDVKCLHKNGKLVNVSLSLSPVMDGNHNIIGISGIMRDISRRLEEEKKLKLFSEAVDSSKDGIQIVDLNGDIIFSNRAVEEMYGYSKEELKGKHVNEMNADPEFAAKVILPSIKEIGHWAGELLVKRKDGPQFTIWLSTSMIYDAKNDPIAMVGIIRDITERKQFEIKLQHSQKKLNEAQRIAQLGSWELNYRTNESYWSDEAYRILGLEPGEIDPSFETFLKFIHPDDMELIKIHIEEAIKTRNPVKFDSRIIRKDGQVRTFHHQIEFVFDEAGKPVRSSGIVLDITERKRGEERLARLNECFLGFGSDPLENINSLTALCGELLGATSALYNRIDKGLLCTLGQWNLPPDYDLQGEPDGHICYDNIKRASDEVFIVRNLPETDYARTDPNVKAFNLKTYVGRAVKFGDDYIGSLCVVYQSDYYPGEDDKKILSVIASAIGVEEKRLWAEKALKESEEKYRNLIETANDAIFIVEVETGIIIDVNRKGEELIGLPAEEIIGMHQTLLHPKEEAEHYKQIFEDHVKNGKGIFEDIFVVHKDGRRIPVEISANLIEFDGKEVLLGIFRDNTERKKSEQVKLENVRLTLASKAKSEFLATMSHELRTPLNSIIGFSELLKQKTPGELNEKQEHYVENVLASGNSLLTLINDILDLSKVEAGKMELLIENASVTELIDESLRLIKEKAAKQNIIIKKDLDPKLKFIETDKLRFKQIFFNILSNAVKFSKKDGGKITVLAAKDGRMARFSIADTGIGIREEDLGKLFKTFEQLDSGISRNYGGTGLGLAISKKLVEMQGGSIIVESKYGEGSTFTFLLPIEAKKIMKAPLN